MIYVWRHLFDEPVELFGELVHVVDEELLVQDTHSAADLQQRPVKPYRTPPSSNIQSSAKQNVVGWFFFLVMYNFLLQYNFFFQLKNSFFGNLNIILYYCIYRNVIPQNLNSLLRLVVAKWTFAVWFHANKPGKHFLF